MTKTFKQFLKENAHTIENRVISAAAVAILSNLKTSNTERYKTRAEKAFVVMDKAFKDKEIYNPEFKSAREDIVKGAEYALKSILDEVDFYGNKIFERLDISSYMALNSYNPTLRKIEKLSNPTKQEKQIIDYVRAVAPLHAELNKLKPYIKSGRKPSTNSKKSNIPFVTSSQVANDKLAKVLKDVVTPMRVAYKKYLKKEFENTIKKVEKEIVGMPSQEAFRKFSNKAFYKEIIGPLFSAIYDENGNEKTTKTYRMNEPVYKASQKIVDLRIEREAEQAASMFYDAFLNKNMVKFTGIIKNNEIKKSSHNVNADSLTGTISFDFESGAKFVVSFSVVSKFSKYNVFFYQFPTRFHNVVKSDGSKLSSPSEEKMKLEFS